MSEEIISDYLTNKSIYESCSVAAEGLIKNILERKNIVPHSISKRVKIRKNLEEKLERKKYKYDSIEEITDIIGIRIILHYSDEVDRVANILEKEFIIDKDNSIDKRAMLDPDRFGYLSLHYIASFNNKRVALVEYSEFKNLKFEIQIRSILQHTWAEIEHDIGYKSTIEIPKSIQRQFSRLAGLLEIADNEFINIKQSLLDYENEVKYSIENKENLNLDAITLSEFINNNNYIQEINTKISKICNFSFKRVNSKDLTRLISLLKDFDIDSITTLSNKLIEHEDLILTRAKDVQNETKKTVNKSISIHYLIHVLVAKEYTKDEIYMFVKNHRYSKTFTNYLIDFSRMLIS